MRMITWLRKRLEQRFGRLLRASMPDGCLVVDPESKNQLAIKKMALEAGHVRFWRIFPVFKLRETGSISLVELASSLFQGIADSIKAQISGVAATVSVLARASFKESVATRIARLKASVTKTVDADLARFNEEYLKAFIKNDRNAFRQKLLEELGMKSAEVFGKIAAKHVAELIMRVRQEAEPVGKVSGSGTSVALPKGTRFVHTKGKMTVFVIEEPPQTRTVQMMDEAGQRSFSCQLSFPHVVFFVVLRGRKSDKMYVLFRNKPLRSTEDSFQYPALPNIHDDFHACFAPSASKESLAIMAEESIGNFWGGRFLLTDAANNMRKQIRIEDWVEGSKKQSLFGLSFPWRNASVTVTSMLKQITQDFGLGQEEPSRQSNGGQRIMTALEQAIEKMQAAIENEMKETCFNLVPSWQVDPAAIAHLQADFKQAIQKVGEAVKASLAEEFEGMLNEDALQQALTDAGTQVSQSLERGKQKALEAAQAAFEQQLKGEKP